jgi:hypothetical protein
MARWKRNETKHRIPVSRQKPCYYWKGYSINQSPDRQTVGDPEEKPDACTNVWESRWFITLSCGRSIELRLNALWCNWKHVEGGVDGCGKLIPTSQKGQSWPLVSGSIPGQSLYLPNVLILDPVFFFYTSIFLL